MKTIIAKEGETLEKIFFRFYNDLHQLPFFLKTNHHLLNEAVLNGGESVILPRTKNTTLTQEEIEKSPFL